MDVDNRTAMVLIAYNMDRSSDTLTNDILVKVCCLQLPDGFWSRLRRVPFEENGEAGAMSRPEAYLVVRWRPEEFKE